MTSSIHFVIDENYVIKVDRSGPAVTNFPQLILSLKPWVLLQIYTIIFY